MLLLDKATQIADLRKWSHITSAAPWYQWLSEEDVLAHRGETEFCRLSFSLIGQAQQAPEFLEEMSRCASRYRYKRKYGCIPLGGSAISPDGRWFLFVGWDEDESRGRWIRNYRESAMYVWCAVAVNGTHTVIWPQRNYLQESVTQYLVTRRTDWLPNSSGILDTEILWNYDQNLARVRGYVWLLDSPTIARILPPVTLRNFPDRPETMWMYAQPLQMPSAFGVRMIGIYPVKNAQYGDPNLARGGVLQDRPSDQAFLYEWEWPFPWLGMHGTPAARSRTITMPQGYNIFHETISTQGDKIAWGLMDKAHYAVVSQGASLHRSQGDGELGICVSDIAHPEPQVQEVGRMPVPRKKEAKYYQSFGLGDWVPGTDRVSFVFNGKLYTAPAP